jgi:hypothetical protein
LNIKQYSFGSGIYSYKTISLTPQSRKLLWPEDPYSLKYGRANLQVHWPYTETGFDTAATEGRKNKSVCSDRDIVQGKPISFNILLDKTFTEFHNYFSMTFITKQVPK